MQQAIGKPITKVLVTKSEIIVNLTEEEANKIIALINDGSPTIYVNGNLINVENDLKGIYPLMEYNQSSVAQRKREMAIPKIENADVTKQPQADEGTRKRGMETIKEIMKKKGIWKRE